jgi:hypothetical protein
LGGFGNGDAVVVTHENLVNVCALSVRQTTD